MYEELDQLDTEKKSLISTFVKVELEKILLYKSMLPKVPEEYWIFLSEVGYGKIQDPKEPSNYPAHFEISERLISAEKEYYEDKRIYEGGALGDILIFGFDSTGTANGFDTGNDYKLVEVDNYRISRVLDINFQYFIMGLLVCYPDSPERYALGKWYNYFGEEFTITDPIPSWET